jgi:hypothetical protein
VLHPGRDDLQAGALETAVNFADYVVRHRVRFDDRKRSFYGHLITPAIFLLNNKNLVSGMQQEYSYPKQIDFKGSPRQAQSNPSGAGEIIERPGCRAAS